VLMAASPRSPAIAAIAAGAVAAVATGDVRWDGSTLSGTAHQVADAARADLIVAIGQGADGVRVVTVVSAQSPNVRIVPIYSVDQNRPLAEVHFDEVTGVEVAECEPEPGFDVARVVLAAELVGVAQRLLDMSVEHASTRVQFDRPIGAFQAVKHRLVDTHVAIERARTLVYDAAMVHDDADTSVERRRDLASLAKAASSEAALLASRSAVQVHAAIAITWEHDVHLFSRRARLGAVALGDAPTMYRRAARAYVEGDR
jgi:alkylation response protein AidB-like acyl-CoA dehydrogenase